MTVELMGIRFDRRRDTCKHTGTRLIGGSSSSEEMTFCADCGADLTIRTDPKLRALIEKVYAAPPEQIAATVIAGKIRGVLA